MRLRAIGVLLVTAAIAMASAIAQTKKPLTNDDVLQMVKAGFDEGTIIKAFEANETAFDTSLEGLLTLKNAGVSEKIINAMLAAEARKRGPSQPTPTSDGAPPPAVASQSAAPGPPPKKQKKSKEPPPPEIIKVSVKVPTLAPLPETKPSQDKGGLKISVAPVHYDVKTVYTYRNRPARPSFKEVFLVTRQPGDIFVERTRIPERVVWPDRLRFTVTISNQMPRVFHGAGIVVQFNVAGKLYAVDNEGYAELRNTIIPPRSEQQVEIYGPMLAALPDKGNMGLFFYDVVTNIDNAGNVTEKQNFEWFYDYSVQLTEEQVQLDPPERLWVTARNY